MDDQPRGTVTFLFTDIARSTELVRRLGTRYADTLGEHRQLVRASFADHERWEIDTQGDAFFVAFDRVRDAVLCAADIQRSLATHASAANLSQSSLEGEDLGNLEPRESKHIFPLTPSEPRILRPGRRRRRSCPSTSSSFRDFHPITKAAPTAMLRRRTPALSDVTAIQATRGLRHFPAGRSGATYFSRKPGGVVPRLRVFDDPSAPPPAALSLRLT
jgi:hypothetical protein